MRWAVVLAAFLAVCGLAWIGLRDVLRGYRSARGATVTRFTLHSRLVHRNLHEILVVPEGAGRGRELLVFLHGRGSSPASNLRQPFFDELHALGKRAPVVLLADGGDHSYWHDRRDGAWGSSVAREAIPAPLQRTHADARRVAIGGISMGGFGALDVARLWPRRFCAVGAHSAALWFRGGDTPSGAFDDAEDFARHDVLGAARARRIYGVPSGSTSAERSVRRSRPSFARAIRAHGTRVQFHLHGGGHGGWSSRMPQYLRFYAAACS